jgi:hypothetical protein
MYVFPLILIFILLLVGIAWVQRVRTRDGFERFIPLNIWQTYRTHHLPIEAQECQKSWLAQAKYAYKLLDDAEIDAFMSQHFDARTVRVFRKFPLGVMRADMWRYCVLFVHGGIYADVDAKALRPIAEWGLRTDDQMVIALENDLHFCQWTIASAPRHPILKKVIELIVAEMEKGIDYTNEHFVHQHTGPGIWTRAIHLTLGFPIQQKARFTHKLAQDPAHQERFRKAGVRIEDRPFFFSVNVRNYFGSTQFKSGYHSWIAERDQLLQPTLPDTDALSADGRVKSGSL